MSDFKQKLMFFGGAAMACLVLLAGALLFGALYAFYKFVL